MELLSEQKHSTRGRLPCDLAYRQGSAGSGSHSQRQREEKSPSSSRTPLSATHKLYGNWCKERNSGDPARLCASRKNLDPKGVGASCPTGTRNLFPSGSSWETGLHASASRGLGMRNDGGHWKIVWNLSLPPQRCLLTAKSIPISPQKFCFKWWRPPRVEHFLFKTADDSLKDRKQDVVNP